MNKKINAVDIRNFEIIRSGVKNLIEKASTFDKTGLKILDIAPQKHNGAKEFFKKSEISTLDIDKNSNATYIADLCNKNIDLIPSNYFDIVICTEVLEHTLNPFNAVNEIHRILKTGGHCFISTPFNFRIHGPLPDCWRFSEYGLKSLFSEYKSIEIIALEDEERFLMPIQYHTIAQK